MQVRTQGFSGRLQSFGRGADLLITFAITWIIPYLAVFCANLLKPIVRRVDPEDVYLWISIHHAVQLALTLVLMKLVSRGELSLWGFNLHEWRRSLRIFGWFCLIYLIPVVYFNVVPDLASGTPPRYGYRLTAGNIVGILGFQLLGSGTCEEPLFRGFVMTFLARSWKGTLRFGSLHFPIAGLWAALFFMAAHVEVHLSPFSLHASMPQLLLALGLGLYYAAVYARTGSLLTAILSHGYSNGVLFAILFTWTWLAS